MVIPLGVNKRRLDGLFTAGAFAEICGRLVVRSGTVGRLRAERRLGLINSAYTHNVRTRRGTGPLPCPTNNPTTQQRPFRSVSPPLLSLERRQHYATSASACIGQEMERLASLLLEAFALALDLPPTWFQDRMAGHCSALRVL